MLNETLFHWINGWAEHYAWLDDLLVGLTQGALVILAMIMVLLWIFGGTSFRRTVLFAGLTGIVALLIGNVLVPLFYSHPRPFAIEQVHQLVNHVADNSFPSDHATGSFAIAFAVCATHRKWGSALLIFAVVTGFSRIYVGIHYPLDIVGGVLVALISAFLMFYLKRFVQPLMDKIVTLYESMAQAIAHRQR